MEALQRLHMSPVGSAPFGINHHETMMRAGAQVAAAGDTPDRKSPMDSRLIMQVRTENSLLSPVLGVCSSLTCLFYQPIARFLAL